MKRVSIVIPADDITAFYRITRPYGLLAKELYPEFIFTIEKTLEASRLFQTDMVIFQRPFTNSHLENIKACKHMGIPVILDFDDDLLAVPETNGASKIYKNAKEAIQKCMELADHITVSTEKLHSVCAAFNSKVSIIPNAHDTMVFKPADSDWTKRNKMVMWRGGTTHSHDISSCLRPIQELSKEHSDWLFVFMGGEESFNQHVLQATLNPVNTLFMPTMPILKYAETLTEISPAISIVPLEFNDFNRAKSNIAWIESTAAGSAVVAPDMTEWKRPGISNYTTPAQFKAQIKALITNPASIKKQWELSNQYVAQHLSLVLMNERRVKILRTF